MNDFDQVRYDAHPPILRNNPVIFIVGVVALIIAGALVGQMPQLLLAVLALIILVWLYLLVVSRSHRLVITDNEVRYEEGILSKRHAEIGLRSVRSVRVNQTFFQRILGVATVEFFSAGDAPEISVKGLPNPHRIRELVDG